MAELSPLGPLPVDWKAVRLGQVTLKVGSGATPTGGEKVYLPSRIHFALIRSQCVHDRRFDTSAVSFITDFDAARLQNAMVMADDVLLNITGDGVTFGRSSKVPDDILPACVNQHVAIIRPNPTKLDSGFLLSYLTHPQIKNYIESFNAGGSRRAITKGHIENFVLPLPPIETQQAIASILGALDNKIDLNRHMNETLETMARAIFDAARQSQEWPEVRLGSVTTIYDGPHATPKLTESGPIFLGISNLSSGILDLNQTNHLSESDFIRWTKRVEPRKGDVVFSYETRLGQAALVPTDIKCCLGRRMGLLRSKSIHISPEVLLYAYLSSEFQDTLRARTIHGSTVDRIPLSEMASFLIRLPSPNQAEEIASLLSPLRAKLEANMHESQTLAIIRDLLLPKLMSGELRVPDVPTQMVAA